MSQLAVPSSSAISLSRGWSSSTARTTIGPPHPPRFPARWPGPDHLQVPDRGQRVALEPALACHREVVEAQGEIGEVAEEAEAHVPPLDAGVEASVHVLRALRDPVAEEQRQDDQEQDEQKERRGRRPRRGCDSVFVRSRVWSLESRHPSHPGTVAILSEAKGPKLHSAPRSARGDKCAPPAILLSHQFPCLDLPTPNQAGP